MSGVESEDELAEIVRSMRTIAVVGMKDGTKPDEPAFSIPQMLKARGVRVLPVNPTIQASLGEPSRASLAAVAEPVDLVDVFRRPEVIEALADEILALPSELRPKVVWMQTGIRNEPAAAKLGAVGIRVVMNRCLGVYTMRYRRGAR
jgi:predicted CoA-binding protein